VWLWLEHDTILQHPNQQIVITIEEQALHVSPLLSRKPSASVVLVLSPYLCIMHTLLTPYLHQISPHPAAPPTHHLNSPYHHTTPVPPSPGPC